MSAEAGVWKVTLACTRAEAEALPFAEDAFADLDQPPTLIADEPDPHAPDDWRLHAYFAEEPEPEWLARLAAMVPSRGSQPLVERLPDSDWVTLSQAGLTPVSAGRFHVATAAHAHERRAGQIGLVIEAGLAFGTGQHATTHGCLAAIDRLGHANRFTDILDLGTGTGVLAMAAAKRWPRARVTASDIDPVSVAVTRDNVRANALRLGIGEGRIEVFTAVGMADARLVRRGPYDLIAANILAAPLIALAGPVSAVLARGGHLVLAGLLDCQATRVTAAYAARGLRRVATSGGEWPTLVLKRP
ncbi:50S ribosomal protein L11 methyltransferase [Glacieibacterium frigidum]|uniref:Ribosomal protein L11 methyltransferase n=1 Tax=Glacieibacterium frigidum TaxID=2593303 RepID=A0A552UFQ2_9SPHN|nr:50S ribosomal protein L11 methyltransferase [Glacieibacterium frigidum]TRW17019.1 50S ribosomal protein L11 methyltransferase [Glacieibacterium frigidum]